MNASFRGPSRLLISLALSFSSSSALGQVSWSANFGALCGKPSPVFTGPTLAHACQQEAAWLQSIKGDTVCHLDPYQFVSATEAPGSGSCVLTWWGGTFTVGPYVPTCGPGHDIEWNGTANVCTPSSYPKAANAGAPGDCPPGKCIGDPVNAAVGNLFQTEIDYTGTGPLPLGFARFYNSIHGHRTALTMGKGWTHTYARAVILHANQTTVSALREDAKTVYFELTGGVYVGQANFEERLAKTPTGWVLTNTRDETETYDDKGRLVAIANSNGLTQTLAYDFTSGLLSTVTDPFGRTLSFTYDADKRVKTVALPDGGIFTYGYSSGTDNLVSVAFHNPNTQPTATTRTYHYAEGGAPANALTGITDENGARFATFGYDGNGLVASAEHAGGAEKHTFVNDTSSGVRTASVTRHVDGTQTTTNSYGFTSVLGVANSTGIAGDACPGCGPASMTPDANGNVGSQIDWNGNRTNYTYDLARNLETSRTEGLTSAGATTPQTRTISTQWHATFRLPTAIVEPLRITTFVYDVDGTQCGARGALCSKSIQATTDADGSQGFPATPAGSPRTWTYTYNANGSLLTVNGPRTDVADVTSSTYYANNDADPGKRGNVASVTSAAGHTTNITAYNAHGQPLTIVDANGLTTTMTYDARQRLKTRTVGSETTSYEYDNVGQLTKVTLPDGSFLSYSYDAAHRLTGMQDNLGNRVAYTLDFAGNRTKEDVFDPANQLAQTRSRVFNNLSRLFRDLGAQNQATEYTYDNQGNVLTVKDPLNRVTTNQYDALNRLKQMTSPAPVSAVTQYAYNGLDALTQVTDPRGLVTGYTVDGLGNLTQQASPDTGTTVNTYDAAGNLLTQRDAKSQTTTYTCDVLNRVTLITFHDGSKQAYAYDQGANAIGRLSSITETNAANQVTSVLTYAYDAHGRVTSETRTVAGVQYVLGYRYDTSGRLDQLTYPSGRTVNYAFDSLGRLSGITTTKPGDQPQTVVSSVAYHPFGGVKGYTLGNGQVYTRGIDLDGRIASYTLGAQSFAVGYDAASRISFINDVGNPANSNTYDYDSLDRLTNAVTPSTPYAYNYDAVGNRLSRTFGNSTHTYTYSATSNRIASITPASGPVRNFVFDPNGSTTADGLNTYVYDVRGRMVQATSSIGTTNYQINALGQRIRKTSSQVDRVFHYDTQGRLIAESDPGGGVKRELIYLGDIPVGVVQ